MILNLCGTQKAKTRQTISALIVSASMLMHGYAIGWISPSLKHLFSEDPPVNLTSSELSWVIGAPCLGAVLSPVPSALLMDYYGRKNSLKLFNALLAAAWLLTYCATSFSILLIARCLAGAELGAALTVAPVYIGEIVEPMFRSSFSSFLCVMMNMGMIIILTIGPYIPYDALAIVGFVFSFIYSLVILLVPESPYYYSMKKNKKKAILSLQWLRGDKNVEEEFNKLDKFVEAEMGSKSKLMEVFTNSGKLKSVIIVVSVTFLMRLSGGNLVPILPMIFPKKAFLFLSNEECVIVLSIVNFLCSFKTTFVSKLGIKTLLALSSAGCGTSMVVMTLWEYFKNENNAIETNFNWVPFICFIVFAPFYNLGMASVATALKGEMFSTDTKSFLAAVVTIFGNLSGFVAMKSFIPIQENFGSQYNFVISSSACFALLIFTFFYVIETEGKSLQEIQKELTKSPRLDPNNSQPKTKSDVP